MPEIDFFLAQEDEVRLVGRALDLGCAFVSDQSYPTPEYRTSRSLIEYMQERQRGETLFFLVSSNYGRTPLTMRSIKEGPNRGKYYVTQRDGGPTIHFFCPRLYEKDGVAELPHGTLSHYPTFWNPIRNCNEKAPPELKRVYAALVKEIKKGAVEVRGVHRRYFVSPGAMQLRTTGVKLAVIESRLPPAMPHAISG